MATVNECKKYDFIIIGSGFGGSVSALRLTQKGYRVLVIEKGSWFKQGDFAKSNWNLKKWLWLPKLNFFGIQKISFFRHVSVLSGVGVGGGSLVYANTLPKPKKPFFHQGSWAGLADWEKELEPFYDEAWRMLGAAENPYFGENDLAFKELAKEIGKEDKFKTVRAAVYFGEKDVTVPDPYFNGEGPDRTGCIFCGSCMTGCRHNAKNTLDKNYLYLAQKLGAEIIAGVEVTDIIDTGNSGGKMGYQIKGKVLGRASGGAKVLEANSDGIILSGGVLGTIPLLLKQKEKNLPALSDRLGEMVRTNNEALIMTTSIDKNRDMSDGIAIGSILETDENTHIEPVRYGHGSGFWRLLAMPMVTEKNFFLRLVKLLFIPFTAPLSWFKIFTSGDFAKQTSVILFMQHVDSTLKLRKGIFGLKTEVTAGKNPTAFIPEAHELARKFAKIVKGKSLVMFTETLTGIPSTAHILGGCVIGKDAENGVIDKRHQVFGYKNMYVCDGSAISANPGVNPSLTITAMSERAMSLIPKKV
jgi:cholesterol oxidase